MFRQIVTPTDTQLILNLPADFVGHQIEVIAFEIEPKFDEHKASNKYTYENAIEFFKLNAVDLSKVEKWSREDLYE